MGRIGVQQSLDDGLLGGAIHFADEIRVGFPGDGEVIDLVGGAMNQIAGATRGLYRDVEHGMHKYDLFNELGNSVRILIGIVLCINQIVRKGVWQYAPF